MLKNISFTDFITYKIEFKNSTKIHQAKYQKLSQVYKWLLRHIIEEGIDARIYNRVITTNSRLFKWNTNPILVHKLG